MFLIYLKAFEKGENTSQSTKNVSGTVTVTYAKFLFRRFQSDNLIYNCAGRRAVSRHKLSAAKIDGQRLSFPILAAIGPSEGMRRIVFHQDNHIPQSYKRQEQFFVNSIKFFYERHNDITF